MMSRDTYAVGDPGNPDMLRGFGASYFAAIIPDSSLRSALSGDVPEEQPDLSYPWTA